MFCMYFSSSWPARRSEFSAFAIVKVLVRGLKHIVSMINQGGKYGGVQYTSCTTKRLGLGVLELNSEKMKYIV